MSMTEMKELLESEMSRTGGILHLKPTWVPRANALPGRRLRLHPQDLYPYGVRRGAITERWLASTVRAENGVETLYDEGLSYIVMGDPLAGITGQILLKDAVVMLGDKLIGASLVRKFRSWPVLGKLFDNYTMIPFHLHPRDIHGMRMGKIGKAEAYYFPPQYNLQRNIFPFTFFGLDPATTRLDIKRCLERWHEGDNGILQYSKAYSISPGTGWDVPAGLLHAPGSLVTYELQRAVDMSVMFQSMVDDRPIPWEALVRNVPKNRQGDLDYLVDLIDWKANTVTDFTATHARQPRPTGDMAELDYREFWVSYDNPYFSAKELTVFPGRQVTLQDEGAYGALVVQGHGKMGPWQVEVPSLVRFSELTMDEFFVSVERAREGVTIRNDSQVENLVILRHFAIDLEKADKTEKPN